MASFEELTSFHKEDYIQHLKRISKVGPIKVDIFNDKFQDAYNKVKGYNDNPHFTGVYEFSQIYTGASIDCANLIMADETDIAINWAGGFHHAKRAEYSGFCYVNDIVIAILELLTVYPRILYLDIDVHHGDGVEEAFYLTNRVMNVSFHQYGENFFPNSGHPDSKGLKEGLNYSLNIPLRQGIQDETYHRIFKPVMKSVMD